jgi:excisionase family DNA binding protein
MPDRPADPDRLIDAPEAADRLRVSVRTLRRLTDAGRGPAPIRVGRCLRWRSSDLDTWIAAGCPMERPS